MNYVQAEQLNQSVADELVAISQVVGGQLGMKSDAELLLGRAGKHRSDGFKVLIVGEFKRGKSTFLNALLGANVLPAKVIPCTAVITRIQYGDAPGVVVEFNDGRPAQALSVEEFRKEYELKVEDAASAASVPQEELSRTAASSVNMAAAVARDRFSHVKHALISYPVELCRHRVELIDSPGLGEDPARTFRTEDFLGEADAIVQVLDATHPLSENEVHFLESVLRPRGLRNIFFAINKWNLIAEMVYSPDDLDAERARVRERFRRLEPFCLMNGIDRSRDRIFTINALGALKSRLATPPKTDALVESGVPALEDSLRRFLTEDRTRARGESSLGMVTGLRATLGRTIETRVALGDRTVAQIESERTQLQPKLDRLNDISRHIHEFLSAKGQWLQERLIVSLGEHMRAVDAKVPATVNEFDLSELTAGSLVWRALTDRFRDDDAKFAKVVERVIEPQVKRFLERELADWQVSAAEPIMAQAGHDVETHLQAEAKAYRAVLDEIGQALGIRGGQVSIEDLLSQWLGVRGIALGHTMDIGEVGVGALGDLSFLIAGIVADLALHMTANLIPGIGLLFSGYRMLMREIRIRKEMREKLTVALRERLVAGGDEFKGVVRSEIHSRFTSLDQRITGTIGQEIETIEESLDDILYRKQKATFDAAGERKRLESARARIDEAIERLRQLLAGATT